MQYAAECKKIDTTTQSLFGDDNPSKMEKLQSAHKHYALDLAQNSNQGNLKARVEDEGKWNPEEVKNEILSQKRIVIKSDKTTSVIISEFKARSKGWVKRIIDILAPLLPKSVSTRLGDVAISNGSIRSALRHSSGELKVQVLPQLEEILFDSVQISEKPLTREDGLLSYPIARAIEWDGVPYIMTSVILEDKNGKRFYDHALSKIEKGKLIWHLNKSLNRGSDASKSLPFNIRDKRIFSLLQEKIQKIRILVLSTRAIRKSLKPLTTSTVNFTNAIRTATKKLMRKLRSLWGLKICRLNCRLQLLL